ncbi:MAG: hypothetical protein HUK20_08815 [Fibrobacter sp.]|nr:hypothetical protein [Fibrobacter sp.]
MNFTQCAEILTASGAVLGVYGCFEKHKLSMIAGFVLLMWGYVMRNDAFLLSLPFIFGAVFFEAVCFRRFPKEIAIAAACCGALIGGVNALDQHDFLEEGYGQYAAYQGPRAFFGDGRFYDFDAALSELEEQGVSGNDLRAARGWMLYDTKIFSIDSLQPLMSAAFNNRYEMNGERTLISAAGKFSKSLWYTTAWCWFVVGFFIALYSKKRFAGFAPWASFAAMALCYGYLFYVNRFVHHVEVGIWLYGVAMLLPFVGQSYLLKWNVSKKSLVVAFSFILVMFLVSLNSISVSRFSFAGDSTKDRADFEQVVDFMEHHEDNAYLLPFDLYKRFGSSKNKNAFRAIESGSWKNIFPLGYWNMYLPGMVREMKKLSVENPLQDMVRDNVFVLQERDAFSFGPKIVWEEHYGKSLAVDTVFSSGKFEVVKYFVAGGDGEK